MQEAQIFFFCVLFQICFFNKGVQICKILNSNQILVMLNSYLLLKKQYLKFLNISACLRQESDVALVALVSNSVACNNVQNMWKPMGHIQCPRSEGSECRLKWERELGFGLQACHVCRLPGQPRGTLGTNCCPIMDDTSSDMTSKQHPQGERGDRTILYWLGRQQQYRPIEIGHHHTIYGNWTREVVTELAAIAAY